MYAKLKIRSSFFVAQPAKLTSLLLVVLLGFAACGGSSPSDPPDEPGTPVAADYDIAGHTQIYDSQPKAVTITPKAGKSTGTRTVYYEGIEPTVYPKQTDAPRAAGNYTVTFNVAAVSGWKAVTGLSAGTLTISESTIETYTITWNNWDDTTLETDNNVASGTTPVYNGATPAKAADAENSYNFNGWLPAPAAVSADATYTAQFTAIPIDSVTFTVTWKNHDGSVLETDIVIADGMPEYNGAPPTKPADTDNTYTFNGWSPVPVAASADAAYTAQFTTVAKHTVTAGANDPAFGTVTGGGKYANGETVTLTATPNTGYKFDNWTENSAAVSTDAVYSFTASKDVSLVANFSVVIPTFTISAAANNPDYGTISGADEYESGATVTLTATPNTGYKFDNWTENSVEVSTDAVYSFTASKDISLVANFSAAPSDPTFTVTVTPSNPAYGSIIGNGEHIEGYSKWVFAAPNSGYQFDNWTENGTIVSEEETYNFTVTKDISLVANFSVISGTAYTITAASNNLAWGVVTDMMGVVTSGGVYADGARFQLNAKPNPGYVFKEWRLNGYPQDTTRYSAIFASIVWANESWVACFEPDPALDPDGDGIPGTPEPDDITITVINGTGSGYYAPGETVTVETSDPNFVYWACSDINLTNRSAKKQIINLVAGHDYNGDGKITFTAHGLDKNYGVAVMETNSAGSYTIGAEFNFTYEYVYERVDTAGYFYVPYAKINSTPVSASYYDDSDEEWKRTLSEAANGYHYGDLIGEVHEVQNLNSPYYVIFWIYGAYDYNYQQEKARVAHVVTNAQMRQMLAPDEYTPGPTKPVGPYNVGFDDSTP